MENLKGHCRTNLDDYDVTWVKGFHTVPNLGAKVRCLYKGNVTTLKVVEITHDFIDQQPYIIVELNK